MAKNDPLGPGSITDRIVRMCCTATAEELATMLDSVLNACVIVEHEFKRRFPEAFALWEALHDDDESDEP